MSFWKRLFRQTKRDLPPITEDPPEIRPGVKAFVSARGSDLSPRTPPPPAAREAIASLHRKLAPVERRAWTPRTSPGAGPADGSRFFGPALLLRGEPWPACKQCSRPMQLVLQLNDRDLPPEAGKPFGRGVLQLFYCTGDDCDGGYEAFSTTHMRRILAPDADRVLAERTAPDTFAPLGILGWDRQADYPNWEELSELGISLTDDEERALEEMNVPISGQKLLGWRCWIQGVDYPNCPRCGKTMRHLFQIDTQTDFPFMLGDAGAGHITICPDHPDVLAFSWDCC